MKGTGFLELLPLKGRWLRAGMVGAAVSCFGLLPLWCLTNSGWWPEVFLFADIWTGILLYCLARKSDLWNAILIAFLPAITLGGIVGLLACLIHAAFELSSMG